MLSRFKTAISRAANKWKPCGAGSLSLLSSSQEQLLLAKDRYQGGIESTRIGDISYLDACTFVVCAREIFGDQCYQANLKKHPLIIDIGANIGLASIWLALNHPHACIYAFEADPVIFRLLESNIRKLGLHNRVAVSNKAVWTHDEGISFVCEGGASGMVAPNLPSYLLERRSEVFVSSVDFAKLLRKHPVIDFLKIDIEGAENNILLAPEVDLSNVLNIFLEYHSFASPPQLLPEILAVLKANKFRLYIKEARVPRHPLIHQEVSEGMDMQLNIYGVRR